MCKVPQGREGREGCQDKGLSAVESIYPVCVTPYYYSLGERELGVRLQYEPSARELSDTGDPDPLGEGSFFPLQGLLRKYSDRLLVFASRECFVHCRHCNRKRYWRDGLPLANVDEVIAYVKAHPEIREIILSGGDPLALSLRKLKLWFSSLRAISSSLVIRVGTRAPVVAPNVITRELCELFRIYFPLYVLTQFNHPAELTKEATGAINLIRKAGIPVLNQAVLLAGVNDDIDLLEELFAKLICVGIKPYYLFQCEPVRGAMHFVVSIERAKGLIAKLRGRLSGLAMPMFCIDGKGQKLVMGDFCL